MAQAKSQSQAVHVQCGALPFRTRDRDAFPQLLSGQRVERMLISCFDIAGGRRLDRVRCSQLQRSIQGQTTGKRDKIKSLE